MLLGINGCISVSALSCDVILTDEEEVLLVLLTLDEAVVQAVLLVLQFAALRVLEVHVAGFL